MVIKQENPLKAGLAGLAIGLGIPGFLAFVKFGSLWSLFSVEHFPLLAPFAGIILPSLFELARVPGWKHLEQRRQAAAQGDVTIPIAPIQLPPSEVSFHLPLQMIPKRNWHRIALISLFLVGAANVWMFRDTLPGLLATGEWVWTLGFVLFIEILFGCGLALLFLFRPLKRQHIEVTTEELHIKNSGLWWSNTNKEQVIRWNDARLFAVYGGKPGQPGTRYELAGADVSLEWRDYRQQRWWVLQRADERYTEQMEMLLAYISARTGLPLYDLR